ncbi:hypothetical protein VTL71DRAFT_11901 [Oculimacula yallundae]|uniref:Uncharacterized protein n=1 Tax=Oculimacula yallundae TaxID=86028 RepID=A0ABR4CRC1_9HELO
MTPSPSWRLALPNGTYQYNNTTTNDGDFNSQRKDFRPGNLIYLIAALVGIIISNACLAIRITSIRETHSLLKLTFTHFPVLITYFLGCSFCVSACLLDFGDTIHNDSACHAAIVLSLIFYLGQKLCLYLFLIERTHNVQAKRQPRKGDRVYLTGLAFLLIGFSAIVVSMFIFHIDTYDKESRICQIGLKIPAASLILGWDVFVNIFLTTVFVRRCEPFMVKGLRATLLYPAIRGLKTRFSRRQHKPTPAGSQQLVIISQDALVHVIRKAVWGCLGILASTAVNFSLLLYWNGREEAWVFFTLFTLDVTWALIILHCLTNAPHELVSKPQISSIYSAVQPCPSPFEHGSGQRQLMSQPRHIYDNTLQAGDNRTQSRSYFEA